MMTQKQQSFSYRNNNNNNNNNNTNTNNNCKNKNTTTTNNNTININANTTASNTNNNKDESNTTTQTLPIHVCTTSGVWMLCAMAYVTGLLHDCTQNLVSWSPHVHTHTHIQELTEMYHETLGDTSGNIATYIPQLAEVEPNQYGVAVTTIDGQVAARHCLPPPHTPHTHNNTQSHPFMNSLKQNRVCQFTGLTLRFF